MDAQQFLYWSLGGGFLMLVAFLCVAIFHLIRILKDFADASDSVKDTAERIDESVGIITQKVNETAEQVTDYVIKPFTMVQYIAEKAKPVIEMMQKKSEELDLDVNSPKNEKVKKSRRFGRKK